ncbi:MAG TPA: BTAD domain-containing putative transcriptional regulator [Albidovulum sp.]|uniref:BTAD domain-containing putative transcriptional regulator n=1 Tax=Albidovulum sp. TaxID=1872424 RepID=UPI002B5B6058|nr:BTAD domain-containing putative transcriptional regulator [Albidovulum sp.]
MTETLTLALTGRFTVIGPDGHDIDGLPLRGLAILAYLARQPGRRAARSALAALVWTDRAEEQARASLRQELSVLRQSLPEGAIGTDRMAVWLGDAVQIAAPAPGLPLLDGFSGPAGGFEDWLRDERQHDADERVRLHLTEAEAALGKGLAAEAIASAEAALTLDPYAETALRLLMQAEAVAGNRSGALAAHARFSERLRADLDAAPDSETEALAAKLRSAPLGPVPAAKGGHVPTLAVLPFDHLAQGPGDMLADGIVDEITAALSRSTDVHVIARQSAFALKDSRPGIREAAERLGADYIVTGTVKRSGERVRITADLAGPDGVTLWSRRFDDRLDDLFDLQDRIAVQVAGQISPSLRSAEITRATRRPPEVRSAYDLLLSGYPLFWSHRKGDNAVALSQFRAAAALDPGNATALAMTAWCHAQQVAYIWTDDPAGERQRAIDCATRAAQLPAAADSAPALVAIGAALTLTTADKDRARSFIDRALAIDPNNAWGWFRSGWLKVVFNEPQSAISDFIRAESLSPLDPFLFNFLLGRASAMHELGDHADAIRLVHRAMALAPGMTWPYRTLAAYNAMQGDMDEARAAAKTFLSHYPGMTVRRLVDYLPPGISLTNSPYIDALRNAGIPAE